MQKFLSPKTWWFLEIKMLCRYHWNGTVVIQDDWPSNDRPSEFSKLPGKTRTHFKIEVETHFEKYFWRLNAIDWSLELSISRSWAGRPAAAHVTLWTEEWVWIHKPTNFRGACEDGRVLTVRLLLHWHSARLNCLSNRILYRNFFATVSVNTRTRTKNIWNLGSINQFLRDLDFLNWKTSVIPFISSPWIFLPFQYFFILRFRWPLALDRFWQSW